MPTKPHGPLDSPILIVGDFPDSTDDAVGIPFLGVPGKELRRMLQAAGFEAGLDDDNWGKINHAKSEVRFTNVFHLRPSGADVKAFCVSKKDAGTHYPFAPLSTGLYVREDFAVSALESLRAEIALLQPKLVVALGNTAAWALLQQTGISKLRGSVFPNALVPSGPPVLPTYHPKAVLSKWSDRPIAIGDFQKARRYLEGNAKQSHRELWIEPTLKDIRDFLDQWIFGSRPDCLSFDVETKRETITCIGFAPSRDRAICIPFHDPRAESRSYWATAAEELEAWHMVYEVLRSDIPKVGQNGLYDIQYCHRHKLPVVNYAHDTMIRHHARHPELQKGLGFMATMYTDEQPWKMMRNRARDNFKQDDE